MNVLCPAESLLLYNPILHFLFGKNFERATKIVDQGGVKRISGDPSRRFLFQVVGESRRKEEYICFPEHHCTCYSFFYDIVNRGEQLCNARCGAEQTQTVTRQSSTITIAPIQGKERSPELDDGGTGFPPPDDGDVGGGGWSGGFFFFYLLAFLGFLKDQESEGPFKNNRRS